MHPRRQRQRRLARGEHGVGQGDERHVVALSKVTQVVATHRAQAREADPESHPCGPRAVRGGRHVLATADSTGAATSRTARMTVSSSSSVRFGRTGMESTSSES